MAGLPKGLLQSPEPGLSVIERLLTTVRQVVPEAACVLVGEAPAYAALGLPAVLDVPRGIGPSGGLLGLLELAARERRDPVLALACDLPYVPALLIERVLSTAALARAVVPRAHGVLQPLCARYSPERCLPAVRAAVADGERALHRLLARLEPYHELPLGPGEADWLRDWDAPQDISWRPD
jgi:molybdopterin-guanine dinucleotide biosynthesis protein A